MQLLVTFLDNPSDPVSLRVDKEIGQGKFSVFRAYCAAHKANFALKFFPNNREGTSLFRREQRFCRFSHPNIIQNFPMTCESSEFHAHLTEFAKYGDFFDVVQDGLIKNNEALIRTYFHQLIAGVEHLHLQGVAHLDLKLDNLVLGDKFQLKIIDFDSAQSLSEKKIQAYGTKGYRAPEIINRSCTDFKAADVYSMGMILYMLVAGEFPYLEGEEEVQGINWNRQFQADKDLFWKNKLQNNRGATFFSEDLIELINGMLEFDSEKRLTIEAVKASKWYNEETVGVKALKQKMRSQWNEAQRQKEKPEIYS